MKQQKEHIAICWLRRDLRLNDHAALYHALNSGLPVLPIFIFDEHILGNIQNKKDARLLFIHQTLLELKKELESIGSTLKMYYGHPESVWEEICNEYEVAEVYANRDYEPYAQERDQLIYELLKQKNITFHGSKDHVIFEKNEVMKDDGKPYTVFTPYSKKWKSLLRDEQARSYECNSLQANFLKHSTSRTISLKEIGFADFEFLYFPARIIRKKIIESYHETRDLPAVEGTSRLSLHLRFGTVSIRPLLTIALRTNEKWLNELIWREFYQMIIYHFPHSAKDSFKPAYDRIEWQNDSRLFEKWCAGQTGYPMVDAGMRELNETGFMHNRVRMVVASFLTKHLLIDWRWGEAYFAEKLLDYELASNVGGWQWAAGSGCDAAPYFRIFNPTSQAEKFDPENKYIRKWVPEFETASYTKPIIDHKLARERCLSTYKKALLV